MKREYLICSDLVCIPQSDRNNTFQGEVYLEGSQRYCEYDIMNQIVP